jgi:acetoin utilization deacetylase AcuC-like enzyme
MITVYTDAHKAHNPPYEIYDGKLTPYAESADRAEAIVAALQVNQLGTIMAPRQFAAHHIRAVHQQAYIDFLRQRSQGLKTDEILYPSYFMSDTYAPVTANTYAAARAAVNAALTGAQLVLDGEPVVYSLCRPPGHHAGHHAMGGYCYFNNAAIAAQYMSVKGRVAILDIDFHHGNGTQDAFYDRDDVLYISIHADPRTRYPYSSGFRSERGHSKGRGYTHNFPLAIGTSDMQYLKTLQRALKEVTDFRPDFLVVSAGFDTFVADPIGGFSLSSDIYKDIAEQINMLHLPTLLIQEGGYNVAYLGTLVANFLTGFGRI